MNKDIILEAEFFLSSFLWGIALLFIYDAVRIFRRIKHHTWAAVAVEDCLFWGTAGIFVFHMIYERNHGIIRGFAAGGMALGMWIYIKLFSRQYVSAAISLIRKAENRIVKVTLYMTKPLRIIYTYIDKQLSGISIFVKGKINKFIEKRKKLLKSSYEHYKIERDAKRVLKLKEKQREIIKRQKKTHKYAGNRESRNRAENEKNKMGVLERIDNNTSV